MKFTKLLFTALLFIGLSISAIAQKEGVKDVKYRRSSLQTILVESDKFPRKETVLKSYYDAPFPEKYNNHTTGVKSFDPKKYALTEEERATTAKKETKAGKLAAGAVKKDKETDKEKADMPLIINKFLTETRVANQMAAKWFNRQEDGSFDMSLIGERGQYDASDMEANIAKGTVRGTASLADAGLELIRNTFVVISRLNFVSNEKVAAVAKTVAMASANKIKVPAAKKAAVKAANEAYEKAKEGYSVWTTAYLYQLQWNDSIEAVFYQDLWVDKSNIDAAKKEAFDKTDLFQLEFVGDEKASSLVLFSLKEKRTEEQIIEMVTIRNIDAVYAKLQKKYDVFKTKTPLYSGNPITAKIGLKEGLEGGEKFEVLEQTINSKTGLTEYVGKGKITVEKEMIWDNRYNVGDGPAESAAVEPAEGEEAAKPPLTATTFKGGKKFYSGMLIRQLK